MATSYTSAHTYSAIDGARSWQPGVFRRIPWSGVSAIIGAIGAIVAAVVILVISDGQPISSWTYAPTVYLSIAYTICNICLGVAFGQGITISWWRKALKSDTQLGDLHRYWHHGNSPLAAALAGQHFTFIAFAAVFVAITPINGPLLQRASTIARETEYSSVNPSIAIATTLGDWFPTGYLSGRGLDVSMTTQNFTDIVQAYYNNEPLQANDTGCADDGMCYGRLSAAGLSVNCSTYTVSFDVSGDVDSSNVAFQAEVDGTNVFESSFVWSAYAPGNISLNVVYKDQSPCSGDLIVRNCSLRPATVQYPVTIDGNKSTITLDPQSTIFDDVVQEVLDYELLTTEQGPTPLGGYVFALQNRLGSMIHMRWVGAVGYELTSSGPVGPQFSLLDSAPLFNDACYIRFADPTDYLVQQARELMFRTALGAGNSSSIQQLAGTSQVRTTGVYRSHYLFLGLAVAVSLAAVLIVLSTFHGYWHLGRNVSLSPVETAKAFNAPLLAFEDSNAEVEDLIKRAGTTPVRYGARSGKPTDVGVFENYADSSPAGEARLWLEIANPASVRPLRRQG